MFPMEVEVMDGSLNFLLFGKSPFTPIYTLMPSLNIETGDCPLSEQYLDEIRTRALKGSVCEIISVVDEKSSGDDRYWIKIEAKSVDGKLENVEFFISAAYSGGEAFFQTPLIWKLNHIPIYLGAHISGNPFQCVDEHCIANLPFGINFICPCGWHIVCRCETVKALDLMLQTIGDYSTFVVWPLAEL